MVIALVKDFPLYQRTNARDKWVPALKIEKYSFNNSDNSWNYVEDKTWIEAHEFNKWKENFYSYLLFNPYNKIGDSPSKLGNIFVNHVNVNKNQTPNHFNNKQWKLILVFMIC